MGFFPFLNRKVKEASSKNIIDKVKSIVLYFTSGGGGRGQFASYSVDLEEIHAAYMTDSYVRQAIDKYADLIFKSGWKIESKNDNAMNYIKLRLNLMAYQTDTPFDQLVAEIATDLVKYGNAYLVKARVDKSFIKAKATPVNSNKVIGGYFRVNPRTMQVDIDDNGNIRQWKQSYNGTEKTFKPEDVVHFYYRREAGEPYGTPYFYQALEDVRLLRSIEDDVAKLVHRFSTPMFHVKVGLPQPGYEGTEEDIREIENALNDASGDGVLITNEKVEINVSGAEGSAIDANGYLKYFEDRVFTGLCVSATQMGRGDTANSSTADSLDQQMLNKIKSFQKVIENTITYKIFSELLLEGGFDIITNITNMVYFKFNEINVDTEIKLQNHKIFMFEHDAITYDELRDELGYDDADESRLRSNMFGAVDNNDLSNLEQPENQHGKNDAPNIKPLSNSIVKYIDNIYNGINVEKNKKELINVIHELYCIENDEKIDEMILKELEKIELFDKENTKFYGFAEAIKIEKLVNKYINSIKTK